MEIANNKINQNNHVHIYGKIASSLIFSHKVIGEGFYIAYVSIPRLSETVDKVPLVVSERLLDVSRDYTGQYIEALGQFRSYNHKIPDKNRVLLNIFARQIEIVEELPKYDTNQIVLKGYLCKNSIYRKTPYDREIADMLLAVNRRYDKTDYIPCICWGRNARYISKLKTGVHIQVQGRIQSREYIKKFENEVTETRTAYEVSVQKMEVLDEN